MPEGGEVQLQLAGLGSRFIAGGIDLIIQLLLVVVLTLVTGLLSGGSRLNEVVALIGIFLIWFGYPIAFELLARGRTPGKRLTHVRVVRAHGEAVDLPASAIRNLVRIIDGPTLAYVPTIISIVATRHNQRPGDLAAGTIVIREELTRPARRRRRRRGGAIAEPAGAAETASLAGDAPVAWDMSAVTAEEIAVVRRFLERRDQLDREARSAMARRLADGLSAKIAGAPREGNAEQFLERFVALISRYA